MEIGKVVREYRYEHDLTMQQFADLAGLSKGYISMLERGRHPQNNREIVPSIETVHRLAIAMDMSIDALLQICNGQQIEIPGIDTDALFIEKYGQRVFDIVKRLSLLDEEDLGRAAERIEVLLEAEKYKKASSDEKAI